MLNTLIKIYSYNFQNRLTRVFLDMTLHAAKNLLDARPGRQKLVRGLHPSHELVTACLIVSISIELFRVDWCACGVPTYNLQQISASFGTFVQRRLKFCNFNYNLIYTYVMIWHMISEHQYKIHRLLCTTVIHVFLSGTSVRSELHSTYIIIWLLCWFREISHLGK